MDIQSVIGNQLEKDVASVWRLKNHSDFSYSDGTNSERYLRDILKGANDLSSRSHELAACIKDWPSEYHLTPKRSQLLSGFSFDRSLSVLEVGCGCGAITRYLGENFDQVVAVEGSINRARLAGERTRDLASVSIVCAPFHRIQFLRKFDVIFCIGVLEYSASYIDGDDPYDSALRMFSDMLTPDGVLVVAIENQFGLKYFGGVREDHLGTRFEGLEGYRRNPGKVRTFGKSELDRRLRKYFSTASFYYPFPDYKIPDCVMSSEFLVSGMAGELVSRMGARDYAGHTSLMWDEMAVILELDQNNMLDALSNSFLVVAGRGALNGVSFDQLAILFSSGRKPIYATQTRILRRATGGVCVEKRKINPSAVNESDLLRLSDTNDEWIRSHSLLTQVTLRSLDRKSSLDEIFDPCRKWIEYLLQTSELIDGVMWIDGAHVDSIWGNAYIDGGECKIIDREWSWNAKIRTNVLVIRAIYDFLCRTEIGSPRAESLSTQRGTTIIRNIAGTLGVHLATDDFAEFIRLESEISLIVSGARKSSQAFYLRWFLMHRPTRRLFRRVRTLAIHLVSQLKQRL